VAVRGFGYDQPRQKCAKSQGEPRIRCDPGDGEAYGDDGEKEYLPVLGPGDVVQSPRDHPFGADDDQGDEGNGLDGYDERRIAFGQAGSWQQRNYQHHGHHSQVLEYENSQSGLAIEAAELLLLLDYAQDYGSAAQRDQKADENRLSGRHLPIESYQGYGKSCEQDLQ